MTSNVIPVRQSDRIDSLDVLRGVALLGILSMNIQSFSQPWAAYWNPTAHGDLSGANYWLWLLSYVVSNRKFISIFTMLFGAGIFLMTSRVESRGLPSAGLHYRRMGWLLLFGTAHSLLLWQGDVLYPYAVAGMIVYLFRRQPAGRLLALGIGFLVVFSIISIYHGYSIRSGPEEARIDYELGWQPDQEKLQEEIDTYRGGWIGQVERRGDDWIRGHILTLHLWELWFPSGLMLIGMSLFKSGWLSAGKPASRYVTLMIVALLVGVPLTLVRVHLNFEAGWDVWTSSWNTAGFVSNEWVSMFLSFAWISLVMLVCRSAAMKPFTRPFAAVGQMAFTNYIMQTLICTTIFYGYGLGWFGSVDRIGMLLVVVSVWIAQLIYSPIWLRYFRFGPLEWLWRSLTYWKPQPIRRTSTMV